uniref:G_PROTEIN_RECEP_F1_2 domain-containing protein n=1 Tax=Loa loa TaxID=7209 RepID=A0A1I7VRM9_LOALO
MFSDRGHQITIFLLLLCCIISRLPTAFAIVVRHFPNCDDFLRTQSTGPADWVHESKIIIRKLPKQSSDEQRNSIKEINQENGHYLLNQNFTSSHQQFQQEQNHVSISNALFEFGQSSRKASTLEYKSKSPSIILSSKFKKCGDFLYERKSEISIMMTKPLLKMSTPVRDAVCTMFAIVTSYLISNSLHLILTILERSQISILRDPDDPMMASTFHTVFSDTVSFVYMFTSAIRIIIYMYNPAIRSHLKDFLPCNYQYRKKKSSSTISVSI